MQINNYIDLNQNNFFVSPYCDGIANLGKAFDPNATNNVYNSTQTMAFVPLSTAERIHHFVLGISLLIPLANIVIYYALRHFATQDSGAQVATQTTSLSSRITTSVSHPQTRAMPGFFGAGVLPFRNNHGQIEVLIGKEASGRHPNTWCDFGGAPDPGETPIETAARECAEETRGLLGSKHRIQHLLQNCPSIGSRYTMYFLEVNDPTITNERFQLIPKDYEKSEIKWVKIDDLITAARGDGRLRIGSSMESLRPPFISTLKLRSAPQVLAQIQNRSHLDLRAVG